MTDFTTEQLEAWAGLGPWEWTEEIIGRHVYHSLGPGVLITNETDGTPWGDTIDQANAALIASAPSLAAALLAERAKVEIAISEIAELKAGVAQLETLVNRNQSALFAREAEIDRLRHSAGRMIDIQKRTHKKQKAAQAEIERLRAALQSYADLINKNIIENDGPNRFHLDGVTYEGPEIDAFFRILRGLERLARTALKQGEAND